MPMTGKANIAEGPVQLKDIEKYEDEWAQQMGQYWRERMYKLKIVNTGNLQRSLQGMVHRGPVTTIEHKFLMYGIYVAAGVYPAFAWQRWSEAHVYPKTPRVRAEAGHLEFLDPKYRKEWGLDEKRKVGPQWGGRVAGGEPPGPRDWYARKYLSSVKRLNEFEASAYGEAYKGLISSGLDEIFHKQGAARNL